MNKLLPLLPALALILHIPATAQTNSTSRGPSAARAAFSRWSLSLETGPSFPTGNFHDKTFYSTSAGSANTGVGAELATTYRLCPSFGLTMSAGFQHNPSVTTPFLDEAPGPSNEPAERVEHESWKIGRLLTGAVYERALSKNKRLVLQIRAMAGVVKTDVPGFKYVDAGTGASEGAWKYSQLSPGFAYQADAGFKYVITKRISVLVNTGYTGSRFTGRYTYNLLNPDGTSFETAKGSKTIALGTIQCRAGIEIGL